LKCIKQFLGKSPGFKIADNADKVALFGITKKPQGKRIALTVRFIAGVSHHFQANHTIDLFLFFARLFGVHPAAHVPGPISRWFLQGKGDKFHCNIEVFPAKQHFKIPGSFQLDGNSTGIVIRPHGTGNRIVMSTQQVSMGRMGTG